MSLHRSSCDVPKRTLEQYITKTRLFKNIENFTLKKTENFQIKTFDIFTFLLKT